MQWEAPSCVARSGDVIAHMWLGDVDRLYKPRRRKIEPRRGERQADAEPAQNRLRERPCVEAMTACEQKGYRGRPGVSHLRHSDRRLLDR